jgi:TPR repeat protein
MKPNLSKIGCRQAIPFLLSLLFSTAVFGETNAPTGIRAKAERGDAGAQYELGLMYSIGDQYPQDFGEAAKWMRKAAEQGEAEAQCFLGALYETGDGVPQDDTEAAKWYRKAADQGFAAAQYCLGVLYDLGQGVPQDDQEAFNWIRKAAVQGRSGAQFQVGKYYFIGRGVSQDRVESAKWMRKAADQGNSEAQYLLALDYAVGLGVEKSYTEATKWMRKAAEQGYAAAQKVLGNNYALGQGVDQDTSEAVKWLRRAADQGHAPAQAQLGGWSFVGKFVPQDYVTAYMWVNLAAAQGDKDGIRFRDFIVKKLSQEQLAEGQRRASAFVARKEVAEDTDRDRKAQVGAFKPKASGTGFFISDDGYLVTNYHVVEDGARIVVKTGQDRSAAKLIRADRVNDLAVLKVTGTFRPLPLVSSRNAKLGEAVFTVGFPNPDVQGVEPKLTKGEINSLAGPQDDPRYFQVSVSVQPGNSGGPLINEAGNVIGVVTLRLDDLKTLQLTGSLPQNVNYAIKSSLVNMLLESVPELSGKLKEANPAKAVKSEETVNRAQEAAALILVY